MEKEGEGYREKGTERERKRELCKKVEERSKRGRKEE